jgi:hypothetical protein
MSDVLAAALIAALASVIGSALTFIVGIRSVRRSVGTSTGEPLGRVVEARLDRVEGRLDAMQRSIGDVREWLAFREGRERPPIWTPRDLS